MPNLQFIFDFASPNAYLSYSVVRAMEKRQKIKWDFHLVLLGGLFKLTNNQPPMVAFGEVPKKMAYIQLETKRFVEKHSLTLFQFNPHFPVNTLLLMRGAIAAQKAECLPAYIEMGLKAMWEDGLKMDDPDVFVEALNGANLDGAAHLAATKTDEVKQTLMKNTEDAAARGAFGVPTFFIDEEMFFGKETLTDIEVLLAAKK